MVEHKCHKCGKIFNKKSELDNHLNRINPCNKGTYECEHCHKKYHRKDTLDRHIKIKHSTVKTLIDGDKNNAINGDNNNITINNTNNTNTNQFFVLPFGTYHVDEDLTTTEKIAIFASKRSTIIEMIIFKTHLNPMLEKYHNCGIQDLHSGYGIINDGTDWKCWSIKDIMNALIDNGQKNSLKIYEQIKHFLRDGSRKEIEEDLNNDKHLLFPRQNLFDMDTKAKKRMITSLKSEFYNQRKLVQEAMKNSGKNPVENIKHDLEMDILRDGVTVEEVDDDINKEREIKKQNQSRLVLKKEIAVFILKKLVNLTNEKSNELIKRINAIDNIANINIIIALLSKSYCRGFDINDVDIEKEMIRQVRMNKIALQF